MKKKTNLHLNNLEDGPVTSYKYDYKSTYRGYNQKLPIDFRSFYWGYI